MRDDIVKDIRLLEDADAWLKGAISSVGVELERTYPSWGWLIEPANQMIKVAATRCHPSYGFYMSDRSMRGAHFDTPKVIRFAGELLERFGMPRRGFERCIPEYMARRRLCNTPQGWLIPDLNDFQLHELRKIERRQQGRVG